MIKANDDPHNGGVPAVSTPEETAAMAAPRKFLFEHSFDLETPKPDEKPDAESEEAEELEPEIIVPTFSEEEMQAARTEAFAKGKEEGISEAAAAMERDILSALQKVEGQFTELFKSQVEADTSILDSAISVATGIARKIFPALNAQGALVEIEHMVAQALEKIIDEPSVAITIHPDLEEILKERMDALTAQAGFKGQIRILVSEDVAQGDCRVEWEGGGARRDVDGLWQEIDEIVERNLSGLNKNAGNSSETEPHPDSPAETPGVAPDETSGEALAEAPAETPVEIPVEASVEASVEPNADKPVTPPDDNGDPGPENG
ncbi:MAG: hypothetical protein ISR51_06550 [Rhodospirillales bacterium]|nr:hypothetical protein [Alphaproteobacteria bacterium]MBL6948319.1 hypothetical protein [Rhodospirillales bacterium]